MNKLFAVAVAVLLLAVSVRAGALDPFPRMMTIIYMLILWIGFAWNPGRARTFSSLPMSSYCNYFLAVASRLGPWIGSPLDFECRKVYYFLYVLDATGVG